MMCPIFLRGFMMKRLKKNTDCIDEAKREQREKHHGS